VIAPDGGTDVRTHVGNPASPAPQKSKAFACNPKTCPKNAVAQEHPFTSMRVRCRLPQERFAKQLRFCMCFPWLRGTRETKKDGQQTPVQFSYANSEMELLVVLVRGFCSQF
jgi:hypothetical protein